MIVKIPQAPLLSALQAAAKLVKPNPQLPVLANLWLAASKGLEIKATDLTSSLRVVLLCEGSWPEPFLITAHSFMEYIQTLSGNEVELEREGDILKVKQGKSNATFPTIGHQEYPSLELKQPEQVVRVVMEQWAQALKQVSIAVATDESRPVLTGIYVRPHPTQKDELQFIGTDGYRLSVVGVKPDGALERELLIPMKALSAVAKDLKLENIPFGFDPTNNQIWLGNEEQQIGIRLLAGDYPKFERIMPTSFATKIETTKGELLQAVKQMAVFARQNANIIKMVVGQTVLISTQTGISGGGETELDVTFEGEPLKLAFNFRYLQEYLSVIDESTLTISLNGPKAPVRFISDKHPNFTHIIMPVDLKE